MGKNRNKNKNLNFSRGEKTMLALVANLNSPNRKYPTELETQNALMNIQGLLNVLNGKAYRVARCIVDKSYQEDSDKIKNYAQGLVEWAETI